MLLEELSTEIGMLCNLSSQFQSLESLTQAHKFITEWDIYQCIVTSDQLYNKYSAREEAWFNEAFSLIVTQWRYRIDFLQTLLWLLYCYKWIRSPLTYQDFKLQGAMITVWIRTETFSPIKHSRHYQGNIESRSPANAMPFSSHPKT